MIHEERNGLAQRKPHVEALLRAALAECHHIGSAKDGLLQEIQGQAAAAVVCVGVDDDGFRGILEEVTREKKLQDLFRDVCLAPSPARLQELNENLKAPLDDPQADCIQTEDGPPTPNKAAAELGRHLGYGLQYRHVLRRHDGDGGLLHPEGDAQESGTGHVPAEEHPLEEREQRQPDAEVLRISGRYFHDPPEGLRPARVAEGLTDGLRAY